MKQETKEIKQEDEKIILAKKVGGDKRTISHGDM